MYALKTDCGVSDDWLAEFVVPNICWRFPCEVGMALGRALLWTCFDGEVKKILPPALSNPIIMAYAAIRRLSEGEKLVKKLILVVTGDDDQLNMRKLETLMRQILTNQQQGDKWGVREKKCLRCMHRVWHYVVS